jgi:hypothetical protein
MFRRNHSWERRTKDFGPRFLYPRAEFFTALADVPRESYFDVCFLCRSVQTDTAVLGSTALSPSSM